jgi:hypothetical protein
MRSLGSVVAPRNISERRSRRTDSRRKKRTKTRPRGSKGKAVPLPADPARAKQQQASDESDPRIRQSHDLFRQDVSTEGCRVLIALPLPLIIIIMT